jgi:hypothetical protein
VLDVVPLFNRGLYLCLEVVALVAAVNVAIVAIVAIVPVNVDVYDCVVVGDHYRRR